MLYIKKVTVVFLLFLIILFISACQKDNKPINSPNNKVYTLDGSDNSKEASFHEDRFQELFLEYPANRFKYSPETKKIYGISLINGINHYISVDIENGNSTSINKFPEIAGMPMGLSTIDTKNQRYFFVASVNNNDFLYVLELNTGAVIFKHKLKNRFTLFEYNFKTDELYGLSRIEGINYFIKYDLYKNSTTVINKIPSLSGISMITPKIDYLKNTFLFVGNIDNKHSLLAIDISNGKIKPIDAYQVNVDDYKVFGHNQKINTIFTTGVQTCVAIAGYNKNSELGFIAHFSPENNDIEKTLSIIEKEIKQTDINGFKDMDLYIVGGVKEKNSYKNVTKVYREIIDKYKIDYQGDKIYHLGKPYNIIINEGNIDIY